MHALGFRRLTACPPKTNGGWGVRRVGQHEKPLRRDVAWKGGSKRCYTCCA
jgi:hypothetical protein